MESGKFERTLLSGTAEIPGLRDVTSYGLVFELESFEKGRGAFEVGKHSAVRVLRSPSALPRDSIAACSERLRFAKWGGA